MEQNKTEKILELILAKMDANRREMKANHEEMMAKMDAWLGKTKASPETMAACEGKTETCLEKKEPTPEETEVVAKPQEVPEGAKDEEAIGAAKDRSKDLRLAVGCRGQLKTRTKRDGRLRQECAAVGRQTRRTVPGMRKGGLRSNVILHVFYTQIYRCFHLNGVILHDLLCF
jgi:hypothetical protein